jgi:mono/diheme cytochrome c family protein
MIKLKRLKLYTITLFVPVLVALAIFHPKPLGEIVRADTEAAETYKTKCAVCHSPKAEKLFDPAKKDEELAEIILKGKKGEKPPFMPAFESKGITAEQAKALVEHMRKLRGEGEKKTDAKEEAKQETEVKSREAIIASYKTNCAACHGAKADKLYDPKKTLDEQAQIILKGKKGAKPPFMPAFEAKGVTETEAKALAAYMIELRTPSN